jgi:hypothetical protein
MERLTARGTAVVVTTLAMFTGPLPARSQPGSMRPLGLTCTPTQGALGVYRLVADQTGPIAWQLNGNGYHFAPGHAVKLELAASHAPTYRRSNGGFTVVVGDLVAELPTS